MELTTMVCGVVLFFSRLKITPRDTPIVPARESCVYHLEASIQYLKITVNAFLIYKRIEFSQNLLTRERKFAIIHCKSKIMEENALKERNKEEEEQKLRTEIKEYAEQMTPEQARMFLEEIKDLKVVHRQQNERNDEE